MLKSSIIKTFIWIWFKYEVDTPGQYVLIECVTKFFANFSLEKNL